MPPDLGIAVNESTQIEETGGAGIDLETNPDILKLWIEQAFQADGRLLILIYILKNHANADVGLLRKLLDERIKNQPPRKG